ncbi:MAG: hypothetical protein JRF63_01450 [Deltaproteobacteria bacterium]|nr:hypothetical protein [Deltaproteobacteria bacterium]
MAKDKEPFFQNKWNVILTIATVVMAGVAAYRLFVPDEQTGERGIDNLGNNIAREARDLVRGKPPDSEVEAHFKDKAGSLPVDPDFDTQEGALCGNGETFYWTSKPPKKAIPSGWETPPIQGTDPSYQGPEPGAPFKESPYAMPSPKVILDRKPIRDMDDPYLAAAFKRALERIDGKVGLVGAREPGRWAEEFKDRITNVDKALFISDNDEVVAKSLIGNGIELVLIDRTDLRARPWIEEKMDTVLIRLRDAVSLSWFHPVVLGSGWAVYRVADPFVIPAPDKRRLTARVRAMLAGHEPDHWRFKLPLDAVGDGKHRVIVSLRKRSERKLKGRKLIRRMANGDTLIRALDKAVERIRDDWGSLRKANKQAYGLELGADLPVALESIEIEIDVLHDICALTDRTPRNMLWYLEWGLEGLMLRDGEKDKVHYLEPSYAVHMEAAGEITFFERLLMKSKLKQFLRDPKKKKSKKFKVLYESRWIRDTRYRFERFRTQNWIERPQKDGGDIIELYRGVPLVSIWDVTRASLVRSLQLGSDWLMNNQHPDGQYAYKYTPTNKPGKRWTAGGNIVRHALNPYTLLMVNKIASNPEYVKSAKKGIDFTLKFLRRKDGRCVICHRDPPARYYNSKLGTNAVTILSILKLGDVADITDYEDEVRCLADELLFQQDPNGHFWQYDVPPDHPYFGAESTIAPGEFVFALARMYTRFGDEKYKEAIDRALPWYMKAWRKLLAERTPQGIYDEEHRVNLIGIVPWLVTAMNDLHKKTGEQKYADIAFEQQEWIDDEFFWYLPRSQYPDYAGSSFKVHRELPAINACQYTEGAAAAYDLAKRVDRNVERRRQVVVHGMRFCLQLQFESYDTTFFLPVPEEAMGGYRYTLGHLRLRNDYNYHAMAAIAQAVEYLEWDDYPGERPLRIPPVLSELLGGQPNPDADAPRTRPLGAPPPESESAVAVDAGAAP